MNIIQNFENNYLDAPTIDTILTPKWVWKHPKSTNSKLGSHVGD